MPPSRILQLLLPALVALAVLAGCTSGAAPGRSADETATVAASRTTVEFGPEALVVAEILRIGDDARATVRMPTRLIGEEILLGDDHYVFLPETELVLGAQRWIHTDLSDPRQRRYHETNPVGFVALADLAELRAGDEFAGQEVLEVQPIGPGAVFLDLGDGQAIDVVTETVVDHGDIVAPHPDEVVTLLDLPDHADLPSMRDVG